MKTLIVLIGVALLGACANAPIPPSLQYHAQAQPQPKPDATLVYFFNETHQYMTSIFSSMALGLPYSVHEGDEDGRVIATLGRSCVWCNNATYTWLYLPPGPHTFTATFSNGHGNGIGLSVTLEAGRIYYYEIIQHPAAWAQDITIAPATAGQAVQTIQSYMNCHERSCGR